MQGADSAKFICNICGVECPRPAEGFGREKASCECGSTVRLRSMAALLSQEIFGMLLTFPEFPKLKGIRGLGMSDLPEIAGPLAGKFDYTNTFYDQEPLFDVTKPDDRDRARYDFIVSSEVMEHVPSPVERALATLCGMLKPDGFLVLTVPYSFRPETDEHFSALNEYSLAAPGGHTVLVNRRADGSFEVFDNLVFHGGQGSTLEMREFSEDSLRSMLIEAGFSGVHFAAEAWPEFGVERAESWSLPIVARKGRFQPPAGELVREYRDAWRRATRFERDLAVLKTAVAVNADLMRELDSRTLWVRRVEGELEERTRWAHNLERELNQTLAVFESTQASEIEARQTVARLDRELEALRAKQADLREQIWMRLGRKLGFLKAASDT